MRASQSVTAAMYLLTSLIAALLIDQWLGEPRRLHPLVGFGELVTRIEESFHAGPDINSSAQIARGVGALLLAVIPLTLLAVWLDSTSSGPFHWLLSTVVLYLAIGHQSLRSHAEAVATALHSESIDDARSSLARIVSRNTDDMNDTEISAAAIESVVENGNDAVFGALFWFVVAGIPGVVAYRLVNTLDAMWGYKNERYLYFGRAAAILDDWLNWLPARLTAASYALMGATNPALRCWREQGSGWKSPNAGPVMAAGAGALEVQVGGPARYGDKIQQRPPLGCGALPNAADIDRAVQLVRRSVVLWVAAIAVIIIAAQFPFR